MRVALLVLCIGAVTFLLRVLVALVRDATSQQPRDMQVYLAKFRPPIRRRKLMLVIPGAQKRRSPPGTGERIA
jgi:hypothetical protein